MKTYSMPLTQTEIKAIQQEIFQGELVVVPTDTVYGIGANPFNQQAVDRLLSAKKRGREFPSPVLIGDESQLAEMVTQVSESAQKLIQAFLPGALTLVLPARAKLGWDLAETGGTVAVRIPNHAGLRKLLQQVGPLAVTSANLHGQPPAVNIAQAQGYFGKEVAVYCDSGESPGLVPSTIVKLNGTQPVEILREGAIPAREINKILLR